MSRKVTVTCFYCGAVSQRFESRMRNKDGQVRLRTFCSHAHYMAMLAQSNYVPWRQGSRRARTLVARLFALKKEHIVHHKDDNQRHNDISNLSVFASHADHMAHHRGRTVTPLWDGALATRYLDDPLSTLPLSAEQKARLRARRASRRKP